MQPFITQLLTAATYCRISKPHAYGCCRYSTKWTRSNYREHQKLVVIVKAASIRCIPGTWGCCCSPAFVLLESWC